jgi:hypothetical protein
LPGPYFIERFEYTESYQFLPSLPSWALKSSEAADTILGNGWYREENRNYPITTFNFKQNHYITDERNEILFLGGSKEALGDRLPELPAGQRWHELKTF